MTERIMNYVTWKMVASAVCVILFAMAGSLWSGHEDRLRVLNKQIEQKVEVSRYETDMKRIDSKLDVIINMHMERAK